MGLRVAGLAAAAFEQRGVVSGDALQQGLDVAVMTGLTLLAATVLRSTRTGNAQEQETTTATAEVTHRERCP